MTLCDLMARFSDDACCRELLERLRWPTGPKCIRCGKDVARRNEILICYPCHYEFRVTTGTIFGDTHLPLEQWFLAVLLLVEARKGMSAMQLKRTIWGNNKGSYKTAWYLFHRIRAAMATAERLPLTGTVELDETYVGGVERGGKRGRGTDKEIVVGIRQRQGELRFFHAADVKSGTLAKYVNEHVSGSVEVIVTDDSSSYPKALDDAAPPLFGNMRSKQKTIKHSAGVYVDPLDPSIHTNTVESAFSLLKRGIVGSWHKVSAKHLSRYLAEMEFRFNRRKRSDLFIETLRHMVTADPLSFAELVK
jgi:transposase-like protein